MFVSRRTFTGSAALALLGACAGTGDGRATMEEAFGLIGEIKAAAGRGEELVRYLIEGSRAMPGNLAYIVAQSQSDPDSVWISEVWRTRTDHEASLKLPQVQAAIARARPIIAGFGQRVETRPVVLD